MLECMSGPLDGEFVEPAAIQPGGFCILGLRTKTYSLDRDTLKSYWLRDTDPEPLATVIYRRDGGKLRHVRTRL
jgi:hypothetical protein